MHKGVKVKFSKVVDTNQLQLSNFFVRNETPPKRQKADIIMTSKGDPCFSMSKDSKYMSSSSIASTVLDSRGNHAAIEKNSEEYVDLKESTKDFTWPLSTFVNPEDSLISSQVRELRALSHNKLSFTSSNIEKTKDDNPSIIQSSTAAFILPRSPDDFTINHWSDRSEEQVSTKIISNNQSHQSPTSSAVPDSSNDISVNYCQLSEKSPSQVSDKPLCENLQATCNSSTVSCVTQGSVRSRYPTKSHFVVFSFTACVENIRTKEAQ